jgi:hypothetical protein
MNRQDEREWVELSVDDDDDGDMDADENLATEMHRYVQFRLNSMIRTPGSYGKTREAVILQLMLIVEFALLTHPLHEDEPDASFEELLAMFPDAKVKPQRVPAHDWIRACASATGAYISMKVLAAQLAHRASCPHCGPESEGEAESLKN